MSEQETDYLIGGEGVNIAVASAIQKRRTVKALGDPASPSEPQGVSRDLVEELVAIAGWAPFHYAAHPDVRGDGPKEPWRVHMLDGDACRSFLAALDPEDNPGKISNMLAIAEALLCVTWLPDPAENGEPVPQMTDRNIEHVAAASAFIQSLLVLATSAGVPNYWSSGGVLRTRKYLDKLAVGSSELLLGAVFLFPEDLSEATVKPGAMRSERSGSDIWARWLEP